MNVSEASTIADLRTMARSRLPRAVFDFIDGGADDELTLNSNARAYEQFSWRPRVLVDVSRRDTSVDLLNVPSGLPLIIAPTGLAALAWARADVLLARAAAAARVPFTISTSSSVRMEEIRHEAQEARLWFQIYLYKDRELVGSLIERARAIGCEALVITVDVPVLGRRLRDHRNRFTVPLRPNGRLIWDVLRCPRWTGQILRHGVPRMQNFVDGKRTSSVQSLAALMTANIDASVTWDALAWIRERWAGKLVLKGVLHEEDAARAVSYGMDSVAVSNHGGRQLDGAPSTIRALPGIVAAVAGRAQVFIDGGVRRGSDIATACALGAHAVMVGRPALYGVGAGGPAGAERMLHIYREELDRCLALLGCPSVTQLNPNWLAPAL